jgi:hypothetical protein
MCFRLYKVLEVPVYIQSGEEKYKTGLQLGKLKQIYFISVDGSFSSTFPFIPAVRSSQLLYCTPNDLLRVAFSQRNRLLLLLD